MANCPNCGSNHIQLKKETDVNWGRAVVGWAVFGIVGGAVGAVTGEDRNVNACLDCGTSWKASDLYKLLQIIKEMTNINLNLEKEADRKFIDDFLRQFTTDLDYITNLEKQRQENIKEIQGRSYHYIVRGCLSGCGGFFLIGFIASVLGATTSLLISLIAIGMPFIGLTIGYQLNKRKKELRQEEIQKLNTETERKKYEAEESLRAKLVKFVENHPLDNC